jgi:hypothetical protein
MPRGVLPCAGTFRGEGISHEPGCFRPEQTLKRPDLQTENRQE